MLIKSYVVSEFTIGFELEAIFLNKNISDSLKKEFSIMEKESVRHTDATSSNIEKSGYSVNYINYWKGRRDTVQKLLNKMLPSKDKKDFGGVKYEASVATLLPIEEGAIVFEWNSPKLKFTISNLKKIVKLLKTLPKLNIITNYTCGFHIHISWPFLTKEDMIWVVCQLAIDEKALKHMKIFQKYDFEETPMFEYFSTDMFYNLRSELELLLDEGWDDIIEEDFKDIKKVITEYEKEKHTLLRIHPQKTLEWRSPRHFLEDTNVIFDFLLHLRKFVSIINTKMTTKTIFDTDRKFFFKSLRSIK